MSPQTQTDHRERILPRLVLLNNLVLFLLWTSCLVRLLILVPLVGRRFLPGAIAEFYQGLYTASILTQFLISYFIIGNRRNRLALKIFTFLQQLFIIWVIIFHYPKITKHTSYGLLIFTVSFQNMTTYLSHLFRIDWIRYLKKNQFIVMFPIQRICELLLILLSLRFNKQYDEQNSHDYELYLGWFLKLVIGLYVPGSYIIYRYLWRIRR